MNGMIEINDSEECRNMRLLLRGIAHEMGNALTVMGYSIKSLGRDMNVNDNEHWKDLNGDFDYICKLYKNLSAYNNSRELKLEQVELDKMLCSIVSSVYDEYAESDINILYKGIKGVTVVGDEVKLKQVFINIIKNAYEAVKAVNNKREIVISLIEKEFTYEVKVNDNGCGIDDENIYKIFEPMYTDKENGTGLGLPVCKNIIESHGGSIAVISHEGIGTEFTVGLKKDVTL